MDDRQYKNLTETDALSQSFERQDDWDAMCSYLEAMESYVPKDIPADSNPGIVYKIGFIVWCLFDVAVFAVVPFILFLSLGNTVTTAFLLAAAALLLSMPFTLMMYEVLWYKGERVDYYHKRDIAQAKRSNELARPSAHDDGDNDLDEIRAVVRAISNIAANIERATAFTKHDDFENILAHARDMTSFSEIVMDYILLSYWDAHEKKIPQGVSENIMRTSAAWDAYVELMGENTNEKEAAIAEEHISKIVSSAQKSAWRNFNRVDSQVHGESHMFDLPGAPRPLTNLEKLSVAAEMTADEE